MEISTKEDRIESYNTLFSFYLRAFSTDMAAYLNKTKKICLPRVPIVVMKQLLVDVFNIFKEEGNVISTISPQVVVGDLHGNIFDLLRILKANHPPPLSNYIFLGDIVDRGHFSLETVTLVYVMKVLFPNNVTVIRGNHEFLELCSTSGFFQEINMVYNDVHLLSMFLQVFSVMPLACLIDNYALCVHGGIGPDVQSLQTLTNAPKPFFHYSESEAITDLLWSDPDEVIKGYTNSTRGVGKRFGKTVLQDFLKANGISLLIRGHQCVDGILYSLHNQCITVFSSSNYRLSGNRAGNLIVGPGQSLKSILFQHIRQIDRSEIDFIKSDNHLSFALKIRIPDELTRKFSQGEVSSARENQLPQLEVRQSLRRKRYVPERLQKMSSDIAHNYRSMFAQKK